jgi:hypothetical protein
MAKSQTSGNAWARSKAGDTPANDRVPSDMQKYGKVSAARDMFDNDIANGNGNGGEAKPFKFY